MERERERVANCNWPRGFGKIFAGQVVEPASSSSARKFRRDCGGLRLLLPLAGESRKLAARARLLDSATSLFRAEVSLFFRGLKSKRDRDR